MIFLWRHIAAAAALFTLGSLDINSAKATLSSTVKRMIRTWQGLFGSRFTLFRAAGWTYGDYLVVRLIGCHRAGFQFDSRRLLGRLHLCAQLSMKTVTKSGLPRLSLRM